MSDDRLDLSVVIACYNEEPLLEDSVRQLVEILDSTRWRYELIFVDDCSRDRTREIIDALIARYSDKAFRRLLHEHNKGRGGTVADGIRMARGDVVGYIDIDLEVHARYIPQMVLTIQNGADVATALRVYKIQPRLFNRFILSQGYVRLMRRLLQVDLMDTETGFKFFDRKRIMPVLEQTQDERWFWDTEIMVRSSLKGYRIEEIPCLFIRRYDKRSSVNVLRDTFEYFVTLWKFRSVVKQLRLAEQQRGGLPAAGVQFQESRGTHSLEP
jgi:glycosyltransferase involved in cell wall biosynthesis